MSAVPTPPSAAAAGSGASARLMAIDAARGLALIGMIIVNVGPSEADGLLERLYLLPYGRASVLFVLIAGLAMTLLLRSRERRGARGWPVVLWRAGLLLAGGLALQLLTEHVSVILPAYALLFAAALPLHRLGDRALLSLAAGLAVLGPVLVIAAEVNGGRVKLPAPHLLDTPLEALEAMLVSGPYPVVIWAVPFIVGLWLGRQPLADRAAQHRMIALGAAAALAGGLLPLAFEALLGAQHQHGYGLLLTGVGHGQMPLWLLSSAGGAVLLLGVLLRCWSHLARWCGALVAAGQLALTIYVGHLLVLAAVGREAGSVAEGALLSGAIVAVSLPAAVLWRRRLGAGPFERLLRGPVDRMVRLRPAIEVRS